VKAFANTCPWKPTGRLVVVVEKVTRVMTVAPAGLTVIAAEPWTPLAAVAVIVTGVADGATPVTTPAAFTAATASFDDVHVKVVVDGLPCASRPIAESASVDPTLDRRGGRRDVTVTTGPATGAPTALLRGVGRPAVKSSALLSVSCAPPLRRSTA
jgi:hypothetical protein